MLAAPPNFRGGGTYKFQTKIIVGGGGPQQKIKFGEELSLRGAYEPQ